MTPAQARRIALSYPEAEEQPHFHLASFRVRGKIFATLDDETAQLNLRVTPPAQAYALAEAEPQRFVTLGGFSRQGAVGIVLAQIDEPRLRQLLTAAWLRIAPKKLAAAHAPDGAPAARPTAATFSGTLVANAGGGHYVIVPDRVAAQAGLGHQVRVRGAIAETEYRSSVMIYSGRLHLGVHAATLERAEVRAGELVTITIARDDEPRPDDEVPRELAAALAKSARARAAWDELAPLHRREHAKHVAEARRPETRAARVAETVSKAAQNIRANQWRQ